MGRIIYESIKMMKQSYLINIYVIPEKADEVIDSVKQVVDLSYGNYKNVYWKSEIGTEYFSKGPETEGADLGEGEYQVVKLEFSINRDEKLLNSVIEKIREVHPWKEPVIRVVESFDSVIYAKG